MKRNKAGIYSASNVTFNPETMEAFSYHWWKFVDDINGKIVFNNYGYSPTTIKHQYKVRSVMRDLGIRIDLTVECPTGLQTSNCNCPVKSVSEYYSEKIQELKAQINKPRSHKRKNIERMEKIKEYAKKCVDFKVLYESRN